MSKYLNFSIILLVLTVFGTAAVSAQLTITIPNIPKIKKSKPTTDTQTTTTTAADTGSSNDTSSNSTSDTKSGTCGQYSFVYGVFLDDIKKKQQEAAAYDGPANKIYYVSETQDDYIRLAVSKRRRDKWFADKNMQEYRADTGCNKLDPALDELAKIAARTLPLYVPEAGKYTVRNAGEEALMKSKVTNLTPSDKIFKIGLTSANWNIGKDEFNLPINRYKNGLIYLKLSAADDSYCRMVFVNVIQDYAGGGTYGASYGRFIKSEVAGCPAGN